MKIPPTPINNPVKKFTTDENKVQEQTNDHKQQILNIVGDGQSLLKSLEQPVNFHDALLKLDALEKHVKNQNLSSGTNNSSSPVLSEIFSAIDTMQDAFLKEMVAFKSSLSLANLYAQQKADIQKQMDEKLKNGAKPEDVDFKELQTQDTLLTAKISESGAVLNNYKSGFKRFFSLYEACGDAVTQYL